MKASLSSSHFWFDMARPLACGLLCFLLSGVALAGDPDDDWGLPTMVEGGGEESSSSGGDFTEVQIGSEVSEFVAADELGQLVVDHKEALGTGFVEGATLADAHIRPVETGALVHVQQLAGGLALQGRHLLRLPAYGQGPLQATLRVPEDSVEVGALLTMDSLDSIDELLADSSAVPAGVSTLIPVGAVPAVNLNSLKEFVDSYGHMLGDGHLSVILLSRDSAGDLHVAAARIATSGGDLEVLIR